ncbi:MAG: hypothetical protein DCC58_02940 [Chloroflexi bacterium]|nr:MAG: hypothetical protein DCC58_02940 [Chloroflexota bacterium]
MSAPAPHALRNSATALATVRPRCNRCWHESHWASRTQGSLLVEIVSGNPAAHSGVSGAEHAVHVSLGARMREPRTLLSFAVAALLIAFAVSRANLNMTAVGRVLSDAQLAYLVLGLLAYYVTFPLRAARWRRILASAGVSPASGYAIPGRRGLTEIFMIGQFTNCVAPAKLGDGYRGYLLKKHAGVSFPLTLGTILAERVVDLILLSTLLLASGLYVFHGSTPQDLRPWLVVGAALAVCGVAGIVFVARNGERVVRRLPERVQKHAVALERGLVTAFVRGRIGPIAALSLPVWILEGVRLMAVALAIGLDLSFGACLFIGLLASLLTAFPLTPAGLGAVESGALLALSALGVGSASAGALVLLDRGITYWSLLLVGAVVYVTSRMR